MRRIRQPASFLVRQAGTRSPIIREPEMKEDLLVRARDLTVKFVAKESTVHAVNGVDFDLRKREVLCILGESGSGKSVTLRALMRLNPPRKTVMGGTLEVGGHDLVTA